jgi:GNAT superfamily N-acetyltransferase
LENSEIHERQTAKRVLFLLVFAWVFALAWPAFGNTCLGAFGEGETRFLRQISSDGIRHSAIRMDAEGKKLAVVEYEILDNGSLFLHRVRVEEGSRGQGFYRRLVREIVDRHPYVDAIEGELGADNFAIYQRRRNELGESPEVAITHVPAYKIRVALGFGEIDWRASKEYRHFFLLRMVRPSGR